MFKSAEKLHKINKIPTVIEMYSEFLQFYYLTLSKNNKNIQDHMSKGDDNFCHVLFFYSKTPWFNGSDSIMNCRCIYYGDRTSSNNEIQKIESYNELFPDPRDKVYYIELLITDRSIMLVPKDYY